MFEIQRSGDKTSSGEIGLDIRTHASPKVGQDQVSCKYLSQKAFVSINWHNKYYVRHKAETHENRRFFSTGMEFAENAYAYVLKAPSRS